MVLFLASASPLLAQAPTELRFEVGVDRQLSGSGLNGRLFVVLAEPSEENPRLQIGETGLDRPVVAATDVRDFNAGGTVRLDDRSAVFPLNRLTEVRPGQYAVQALLDTNIDLKSVNAPGNLYTNVEKVTIAAGANPPIRLVLNAKVPDEALPSDEAFIKFIKLRSELLSRFHGRTIYLRAGVILPRTFDANPAAKFPLRVHIGGYGSRFTRVQRMMAPGSEFRKAWESEGAPSMILLHLDGDGPLGDPYQVNSENHGPYGDAITQELIPYVEARYRGIGEAYARVTDGGSTGGWVSLALKVFYPDFFNAVWSSCADGVDFRAFQLINIYEDTNAYVNKHGFERPSARDLNGDVRFTMRHEAHMENVMGLGDRWVMSGGQWGAWNATYGPRGADGRPVPLWDPRTGAIDRSVVEHWKKYDLRLVIENGWRTLGTKLRGKLNIWMGEADNYFLNNAMHMLGDFLEKADPPSQSRIVYGPGKGHCFRGVDEIQLMNEMAGEIEKSRPRAAR